MNRRDFLKLLAMGVIGWGVPREALTFGPDPVDYDDHIRDHLIILSTLDMSHKKDGVNVSDYLFTMNDINKPLLDDVIMDDVLNVKDYLLKMKDFDKPHTEDIVVSKSDYSILRSTLRRIRGVQAIIGNGHFQILGFDDARKIARTYSRVGSFSKAELNFMEEIFYKEASLYGFTGEKPIERITDRIDAKEVVKVPYTGNYLYKGVPMEMYEKIKRQIGKKATLTSGVRGVMKQFYLFLNKAYKKDGNLSLASRSLAPPGHSFHGTGDFDVGQAGFGVSNFTERFTTTNVFKRLYDLGYLKLRYPRENYVGVRFEPWHIKTNLV